MKNLILSIALCGILIGASTAQAQITNPNPAKINQIAVVLPKVVLKQAFTTTIGGKQYSKMVLTVTNRNKLDPKMFELADNVELPPDPCGILKMRVVISLFGMDGKQLKGCGAVRIPHSLSGYEFTVEKSEPIPQYVYIVLTDRKTGFTYKSNLVSPWNGKTK